MQTPEEALIKLIDNKIVEILKVLIKNQNNKMRITDISHESKVPIASTFRILKKLEKLEIVKVEEINKLKLFSLAENKTTAFIKSIIKLMPSGLEYFLNKIKELPNVQQVILQGPEKENSVNLILLGYNIDNEFIRKLVQEIYNKYKYNIIYLILTKEQYEQMKAIGLYGSSQKVIYNASQE
ncbi:MAG: hypothetical protein QXS41_02970 [Candidatus Woesearchaeota archaeon]